MRALSLISCCAAVALAMALPARTQSINWTYSPAGLTSSNYAVTAFADSEVVVVQLSGRSTESQLLRLFNVETQTVSWSLPSPCPFAASTSGWGKPQVYNIRRTAADRLTYLCWITGENSGHVVAVSTATGNITSSWAVQSAALVAPEGLYTIGSVASGAYCVAGVGDALCISGNGAVWSVGSTSSVSEDSDTWINEYNGTLAVQSVSAATVSMFDTWTGLLVQTVSLPLGSSKVSRAGERFLVATIAGGSTYSSSGTSCVVLDMRSSLVTPLIALPGASSTGTGQGASGVAQMLGDTKEPQLIVTLCVDGLSSLQGWKVPATTQTAVSAKPLFRQPLYDGSATQASWAVSPGFVVISLSGGSSSSTFTTTSTAATSSSFVSIVQVATGRVVSSFTSSGAPQNLLSVAEQDDYVVVNGNTAFSNSYRGNVVMAISSKTGKPLWMKDGVDVPGPDLSPIDLRHSCVIVTSPEGSTTSSFFAVECLSL